jgi:hypothetical protein
MTTNARAAQATVTFNVEGKARRPRATTSTHRRPQQRHRLSRPSANILEEAERALTIKAVEMALRGDKSMLRFCFDRLDRLRDIERKHAGVDLPEIKSLADIQAAIQAILNEAAKGSIEPKRGLGIVDILGNLMSSMNNSDLVGRLERLDDSSKD